MPARGLGNTKEPSWNSVSSHNLFEHGEWTGYNSHTKVSRTTPGVLETMANHSIKHQRDYRVRIKEQVLDTKQNESWNSRKRN